MVRSAILLAIAATGLTCCQTSKSPDVKTYPTNYLSLVRDNIKANYFDPYSMRDVKIAPPIEWPRENAYAVCFEANSKNRIGAYVGLTKSAYIIDGGSVVRVAEYYDNSPFAPACEAAGKKNWDLKFGHSSYGVDE